MNIIHILNMTLSRTLLLAGTSVVVVAHSRAAAQPPGAGAQRAVIWADSLVLHANIADVKVVRASADSVVVDVRPSSSKCGADSTRLEVRPLKRGTSAVTVVAPRKCRVALSITAPAAVSIDLTVDDGEVRVAGGTRPVSVRGKAVDVYFDAVAAPVTVALHVGDIKWQSGIELRRGFTLRSGVGSVRYRVDGEQLRSGQSPGSGDHLSIPGGNNALAVRLQTGVGSVVVDVSTRTPPDSRR
jgi:hypothetical protein